MGWRLPGPVSLMDIGAALDPGTLNPQRNNPPGITNGSGVKHYQIPGTILVGKANREPGKTEDGNDFEDILFADNPPQAISLKSDPLFKRSDADLEQLFRSVLIEELSLGDLHTVAVEAWDRFRKGTGGTYSNPILTKEVQENDATKAFAEEFTRKLWRAILARKGDLTNFSPLQAGRYAFESIPDKLGGMGILIHDWWSIKAELKGYTCSWDQTADMGAFYGSVIFTCTDTFGLDWQDLMHGPGTYPYFGPGFKAWYILQHFRKAKPFFIQAKVEYGFTGSEQKLRVET